MEVTKLLKRDHARVKHLFDQYEALGDNAEKSKQEIFDKVYAELDVHARVEEELFYPFVKNLKIPELDEMVAESFEEHRLMKQLLSEIKSLSPSAEEFDAKMKVLKENVLHHAKEEEEAKMFPLVMQAVPTEIRSELGVQIAERKEALEKGWTGMIADWFRTLIPSTEEA